MGIHPSSAKACCFSRNILLGIWHQFQIGKRGRVIGEECSRVRVLREIPAGL